MAFLRAKKTDAPRKRGGSPTAFEECTRGVRLQGAFSKRVTRKSIGMSFAVGILYVPAAQRKVIKTRYHMMFYQLFSVIVRHHNAGKIFRILTCRRYSLGVERA